MNPNSGPGDTALPDGNYTREIPRLNAYSNVRTVGYVSTSWANRPLSSALQDISTYAGWAKNSSVQGLSVQGIFFDETPSIYTTTGADFLNSLAAAINFLPGLGSTPLVRSISDSYISRSGNFSAEVPAKQQRFVPCTVRNRPFSFSIFGI